MRGPYFRVVTVSLPRVWVQKIKCMPVTYLTHGLFLTCTQKYQCIYKLGIAIFTECTATFIRTNPLPQQQSNPAYLLGEPASLLVVTNTHPPLSLICQQLSRPLAFTPLALSCPTVWMTLFTWTTSTILVVLIRDSYCSPLYHKHIRDQGVMACLDYYKHPTFTRCVIHRITSTFLSQCSYSVANPLFIAKLLLNLSNRWEYLIYMLAWHLGMFRGVDIHIIIAIRNMSRVEVQVVTSRQ